MPKVLVALLLMLALTPATQARDTDGSLVWWEGECPIETSFPDQTWFSPRGDEAGLLSGGDWLTGEGKCGALPPYATYRVMTEAGRYELWVRKFWRHGPFRWRFNHGAWTSCTPELPLVDHTDLRTHVCANWVRLGDVVLEAGVHEFRIELLVEPGGEITSGLDCFVLSRDAFVPNGRHRPGARTNLADPGFFPWEPVSDAGGPRALLDLRLLNEDLAGQSGFVRSENGNFVLGNGDEVRFWGVNVTAENAAQSHRSVDAMARRLARLGVNLVRYHAPLFDREGDLRSLHAKRLDDLHYLVAALKREGIYTAVSFYFPLWLDIEPRHGIAGYETITNKEPFGLLFFEPQMRELHRGWLQQLLSTPNPYLGPSLADEPALAMVEIVNEDSLLFWTFKQDNVPAQYWSKWEHLFGRWLMARDHTLDAARRRWQGSRHPHDDYERGRVGLLNAWELTREGWAGRGEGRRRRAADQVRFLTEVQRSFYESTTRYVRQDLGYGGLVIASNWKVSDPELLDALERYTCTPADVLDRHAYFDAPHEGDGASHSVRLDHRFRSASALRDPARLPVQANQVVGFPQIISELNWSNPNRWRAEAAIMSAAYGALQSIDGLCFFALASNSVRDTSIGKHTIGTPVMVGSFPAAALMYRRGDVREAPVVLHERLDLDRLFALEGSAGAASPSFDQLRGGRVAPAVRPADLDPRWFLVGRVQREFDPRAAEATAIDPTLFIDDAAGTIRSATEELALDARAGILRINTPRAQGAVGFLGGRDPIDLEVCSIDCQNEYAAVLLVSLDGRALAQSRAILIQAVTEEQPYGFEARNGRITNLGSAPFGVKRPEVTLTIRLEGEGAPRLVTLDENGVPRGTAHPVARTNDGTVTIRLPDDALHHILRR